jgi:DNA (cytosine-5)-methyltransferase 1
VVRFGLHEDLADNFDRQGGVFPCLCPFTGETGQLQNLTTRQALDDLPPLRSGLSWLRTSCRKGNWEETLGPLFADTAASIEEPSLRRAFEAAADQVVANGHRTQGERSLSPSGKPCLVDAVSAELRAWYQGQDPLLVLNHQTRNHMPEDLARYLFCAVYAQEKGISPKAAQFPAALAPRHQNWESGKFDDRFRVQIANQPAATVMSHMAKDGHYSIHYEPAQCRSMTVREAARLQTFPDSYFFEGTRTQQYTQVGNAVPPFLARQIAGAVWDVLHQLGFGMP